MLNYVNYYKQSFKKNPKLTLKLTYIMYEKQKIMDLVKVNNAN
jgi:hypothetical protein